MSWELVGEILGGIVVVLLAVWGGWRVWKHIPREIAEAFMVVAEAVEDDNITREELKKIVESFRYLILKIIGK